MSDACEEKKDLEIVDEIGDDNWDDEYVNDDRELVDKMIHEVKYQS